MVRRLLITLAVIAVLIGVALATEARLNRNEPRCRYWPETQAHGCADHGEPQLPPFLRPARPGQ